MKRNMSLTNTLLSIIAACLCLIVVKLYSLGNTVLGKAAIAQGSPSVVVLDDIKLDDTIPIKVQIYGRRDTTYSDLSPITVDVDGNWGFLDQSSFSDQR